MRRCLLCFRQRRPCLSPKAAPLLCFLGLFAPLTPRRAASVPSGPRAVVTAAPTDMSGAATACPPTPPSRTPARGGNCDERLFRNLRPQHHWLSPAKRPGSAVAIPRRARARQRTRRGAHACRNLAQRDTASHSLPRLHATWHSLTQLGARRRAGHDAEGAAGPAQALRDDVEHGQRAVVDEPRRLDPQRRLHGHSRRRHAGALDGSVTLLPSPAASVRKLAARASQASPSLSFARPLTFAQQPQQPQQSQQHRCAAAAVRRCQGRTPLPSPLGSCRAAALGG